MAASQFSKQTNRGSEIRPGRVADLLRQVQDAVRPLSATDRDAYLASLASYLDTISPDDDATGAGAGSGIVLSKEAARRLSMAAGEDLNPEQVELLLNRALLFVTMIDQLVWGVWKNIAPGSKIKRETKTSPSLSNVIRTYLSEPDKLEESEVIEALEKTRQLAAGLLGALGPVGRNYGTRAAARFNPDAIREIVTKEGAKGEVQYWKKYEELFQDLREDAIEQEIHGVIVRYAEDLLRGSRF